MGATVLGTERMTGGTRTINSTTSTFLNQQQTNSGSNNESSNNFSNNDNIDNMKKLIKNKNKNKDSNSGKMIKRVFLFSEDPHSIEVLASEGDQALIMLVVVPFCFDLCCSVLFCSVLFSKKKRKKFLHPIFQFFFV